MTQRGRNLFLAWLAYGALQLALLGAPGAAGRPGVGQRGARSQSEVQSVSLGKRALASELSHRRTPTPFAPATYAGLDLPATVDRDPLVTPSGLAPVVDSVDLPPARAPPAL
jgi:hypothetical protein